MNVKIFNGTPEQVQKDLNDFLASKLKFKNAMMQRENAAAYQIYQSQSTIESVGESLIVVNLTITVIWE